MQEVVQEVVQQEVVQDLQPALVLPPSCRTRQRVSTITTPVQGTQVVLGPLQCGEVSCC